MSMVETMDAAPLVKLEVLLRFHIKQMIENFEEVYVVTGNGVTWPSPIYQTIKTSAAVIANALQTLFSKALSKAR